ncbi:MAG: site-specific integrase [Mucilaginibacter polytrichastri]|nr:site-specific integrase [Mucilaginibacter polytrichastri]
MKTNFRLLFYLKKPRGYMGGEAPIYLRITQNLKRTEISTGRGCDPSRWNADAGRASGIKEESRSLNAYLDLVRGKVYEAHRELLERGKTVSARTIKDILKGKGERQYLLLEIFQEHNDRMEEMIDKGFTPNTLKGYKTSIRHLRKFVQNNYRVKDVDIHEVNHEFITRYEFFLRTACGHTAVSAAKYIKHFRKIINWCLANDWIQVNPFARFKSVVKPVVRVYLTSAELRRMKEVQLDTRLDQVRDIFLFSCYTGLAYGDVKKLQRREIAEGIDGDQWIFTQRKKTETVSHIPLLKTAKAIVSKYADHPQCAHSGLLLPVLSNQKMNAYLKEIAERCQISKVLTFHTARHTFATTITLSNGVPIETVSKMLGHTDIKTTQHYARVLDVKVSRDMMLLKEKLMEV